MPLPYCVYILFSRKDFLLYTGFTTNLDQRLIYHNEGRTKSTIKQNKPEGFSRTAGDFFGLVRFIVLKRPILKRFMKWICFTSYLTWKTWPPWCHYLFVFTSYLVVKIFFFTLASRQTLIRGWNITIMGKQKARCGADHWNWFFVSSIVSKLMHENGKCILKQRLVKKRLKWCLAKHYSS